MQSIRKMGCTIYATHFNDFRFALRALWVEAARLEGIGDALNRRDLRGHTHVDAMLFGDFNSAVVAVNHNTLEMAENLILVPGE